MKCKMSASFNSVEHSENKITMLFGLFKKEIRLEVLQLTIQKICTLQENQRQKESAAENVSILPLLFRILTGYMFVNPI